MTESIADRYRRRAASFTDVVVDVPADQWSAPSPCAEWDARGVLAHVVGSQETFARLVERELDPGPLVDDDPVAAWTVARDQTQAALDDPEMAAAEFDGFAGRTTFAEAVDRFLSFDLVIHRWDLARAVDLDDTIPEVDLDQAEHAIAEMHERWGESMRSPTAFGPPLTAPAGADRQTRMLAFLGRMA